MKKSWLFVLLFILLPGICRSDEYKLVMSKNDCLCQHILKLYNADIKNSGQVKYEHHKEFNWPKWEHKQISLVPLGVREGVTQDIDAKIAFFDINNDTRDEAVVYSKGSISNSPTDEYDVFDGRDIAFLNKTVDGRVYYQKRLKGFSSSEGIPVKIADLSEEDVKKMPEKVRYSIQATEKRGGKYTYFGNADQRINFMKFANRLYITFEERSNAEMLAMALDRFYGEGGDPKTSRRSNEWLLEGFNNLEKYSIVSDYQQDNTLNIQCLYLRKDSPAKMEVK